jgi:hypothetical protein
MLSGLSTAPIPKGKLMECVRRLAEIVVEALRQEVLG